MVVDGEPLGLPLVCTAIKKREKRVLMMELFCELQRGAELKLYLHNVNIT
jgi:hypothetical protein